jgi:hypothetical protein
LAAKPTSTNGVSNIFFLCAVSMAETAEDGGRKGLAEQQRRSFRHRPSCPAGDVARCMNEFVYHRFAQPRRGSALLSRMSKFVVLVHYVAQFAPVFHTSLAATPQWEWPARYQSPCSAAAPVAPRDSGTRPLFL